MAVLIDPPRWPAHGRVWSHLASDTSLDELHAFAGAAGIPRRAFEGDHYDVPAERYQQAVAAGAVEVAGRELLRRLVAAGLRVPKRRGERVVASSRSDDGAIAVGPHLADLVVSPHPAPDAGAVGAWVLVTAERPADARGTDPQPRVLLAHTPDGGWDLPGGMRDDGEPLDRVAVRSLLDVGVEVDEPLAPVGYLRVRPLEAAPGPTAARPPWTYRAVLGLRLDGTPAAARRGWHRPAVALAALDGTVWAPLVGHVMAARASPSALPRGTA